MPFFYNAFKINKGYYPGIRVLNSPELNLNVYNFITGDIFISRYLLNKRNK